ncbi:MAG: nucleotidyltransferase [Elusimicrobia bacterium]|nr:nucleotidyltransferase [Elusimicrobiota bacterium]MBU2614404.1 nucleotidyltransferase [Elusimicrobiota bacterium]
MVQEKQVENDYREFIELLNKNKVDYLVIGAYSTIFHTKIPRETQDIDFWIRKTEANAEKCVKAIKEFCGIEIGRETLLGDKEIFFIGQEPNRIDIFNTQKGLSFEEAYSHKEIGTFKGTQVCFVSKKDLIRLKEYFGRNKDIKDLKRLKKSKKK